VARNPKQVQKGRLPLKRLINFVRKSRLKKWC